MEVALTKQPNSLHEVNKKLHESSQKISLVLIYIVRLDIKSLRIVETALLSKTHILILSNGRKYGQKFYNLMRMCWKMIEILEKLWRFFKSRHPENRCLRHQNQRWSSVPISDKLVWLVVSLPPIERDLKKRTREAKLVATAKKTEAFVSYQRTVDKKIHAQKKSELQDHWCSIFRCFR